MCPQLCVIPQLLLCVHTLLLPTRFSGLLLQRDASSDDDSEAEVAEAAAAAPSASRPQQPLATEHNPTAQPQLPAHSGGHSPVLGPDAASVQAAAPPHWPSHGYGGFAASSGTQQRMQTAAAAADFLYPSVPLPHQVSITQSTSSLCF